MLETAFNMDIYNYYGYTIQCVGVTHDKDKYHDLYEGLFKCDELGISSEDLHDFCNQLALYIDRPYFDIWIDISNVLWFYKAKIDEKTT